MRTTCSIGDSAILVLPHGASEQFLPEPEELLQYLPTDIIERWKSYTESSSLLLVTGCVKSRSWGVAEVSNGSRDPPVSLTLNAVKADGQFTGAYIWQHNNDERRRTQAGPSLPSDIENQCIFLRGYTLSARKNLFEKSRPEVVETEGGITGPQAVGRLKGRPHAGGRLKENSPADVEGIDNEVCAMSQVTTSMQSPITSNQTSNARSSIRRS